MTSPGKSHIRRALRLASVLVLAAAAAACGSSATTAPVGSQPASSAAATAAAAPSSGAACGADALAAITKKLADPAVTAVKIIGGCHQASIETSLAATDVTKGLAFCDAAAAVGYISGVSSITVQAATGKELAAGLKDTACIGEP